MAKKFYEVAQIRLGKDYEDKDGNPIKGKSWVRIAPEERNGQVDVSGIKRLISELQDVVSGKSDYVSLSMETPEEQLDRLKHFTNMTEDDYLYRKKLYENGGKLSFIKRYLKLIVD